MITTQVFIPSTDTLENSDPTATHATKFAKLAIAYLVETSLDSPVTGPKELQNDVPVEGLTAGYGEEQFFTFTTQSAGQLTVTLTGPRSGDADLYVKHNGTVSKASYDCRPYQNSSNEQCVLNRPAGEFNIMVRGYRNFNDVTIVANFVPGWQ